MREHLQQLRYHYDNNIQHVVYNYDQHKYQHGGPLCKQNKLFAVTLLSGTIQAFIMRQSWSTMREHLQQLRYHYDNNIQHVVYDYSDGQNKHHHPHDKQQ